MTIYICSKTISCFLYSRKKAEEKEKLIQGRIAQLYYDEVYSKSDEYIEKQTGRAEAEYFAEHPEEWERLERQFEESINETSEDRVLKDLYCCICGFSAYGIEELLAKLDTKSKRAIAFWIRLAQRVPLVT